MLVWPVARLYTEKYLNQDDKDRISAMVDDIMAYYHEILEGADFLSEETRANAVEKLETIHKFILYPDDWSKYSCEELSFKSKEEGGTRKWSITTMLCTPGRAGLPWKHLIRLIRFLFPYAAVTCFLFMV